MGHDLGDDRALASEDCMRGLSKSRAQQILLGGWRKQGIGSHGSPRDPGENPDSVPVWLCDCGQMSPPL